MTDDSIFTAWVTPKALTSGIKRITAQLCEPYNEGDKPDMIKAAPDDGTWYVVQYYHGEGRNWHRTYKAARERAEVMRTAKIANLKKQIAKLERMRFDEEAP